MSDKCLSNDLFPPDTHNVTVLSNSFTLIKEQFQQIQKKGFFLFSFWHFCQYVWHAIYANWTSLISIFFGSIGSTFFLSHLTVCASNFGHENSLIIFLIRACLLRCHYSVLVRQSPHPFNLDSKYHLHVSREIVTSPQHVVACADARRHTHSSTLSLSFWIRLEWWMV